MIALPRAFPRRPSAPVGWLMLAWFLVLSPNLWAQDQTPCDSTPVDTMPTSPTDGADPQSTAAPSAAASEQPIDIEELKRRLDVLAAEIEQLRSGEQTVEISDDERRTLGLGPSAAAAYRRKQGVSFAGYGEMLYEDFDNASRNGGLSESSRIDFLRAILYAGYRFNDKFIFNSEIEVEHVGEVALEFAYLDYRATNYLTVRAGNMLIPLGLINEFHEPNVFLGARRPETERRIVPSTWHENGAGVLGSHGPFSYRAYVVNGLNATGFAASGLRDGRQDGGEARADEFAFAGRLDVTPLAGGFVGAGLYAGGSGQGDIVIDGRSLDVTTTIVEVHGQYQARGLDFRGLFARASVDDALALSLLAPTESPVASEMLGGYVQVGYNVLSQFTDRVGLTPYYRFEHVNTQSDVPAGFQPDPMFITDLHTFGFEFRPLQNIVVKTDYQWIQNEAGTGRSQFNIALGYAF